MFLAKRSRASPQCSTLKNHLNERFLVQWAVCKRNGWVSRARDGLKLQWDHCHGTAWRGIVMEINCCLLVSDVFSGSAVHAPSRLLFFFANHREIFYLCICLRPRSSRA